MKEIGAYEAKTKLSQLLEDVRKGSQFTITKNGLPVAVLSPISNQSKEKVGQTISKILDFRSANKLGSVNLRDLIQKGRR